MAESDANLLEEITRAEFTINGFRNRDLRAALYPRGRVSPAIARTRAAKVTRQLRLLRAHHLIRKISGTHRYILTDFGRQALTALLNARRANTKKLLDLAA